MKKRFIPIILILMVLLLSACKEDQKVEPVEVPDQSQGNTLIQDGQKQLKEGKEQLDKGKTDLLAGKEQLTTGKEQLLKGKEQLDKGKIQLENGKKELDKGKKQIENGRAQLEKGKKQLEQGKIQLEKGKKQIENGRKELKSAGVEMKRKMQEGAIAQASESRFNSLQWMKRFSVKEQNKYVYAFKYFAMMDLQFSDDEKYLLTSVNTLLADTRSFFPKKYNKIRLNTYWSRTYRKKAMHLYAMSTAIDFLSPKNSTKHQMTFFKLLKMTFAHYATSGEKSNKRFLKISGYPEAVVRILENKAKFIYLLRVRHNALVDVATLGLSKKKHLTTTFKWTVNGKGYSVANIQRYTRFLVEAKQTLNLLIKSNISTKKCKTPYKRLKKMRIRIRGSRGMKSALRALKKAVSALK